MNLLDNFISILSPKAGAERAKYRAMEAVVKSSQRSYEAASRGRRGDRWSKMSSDVSANIAIARDLHLLRDRATHAYNNNPDAFKAIRTIQNNTIGTGIMPTPVSDGKKLTEKEVQIIKDEWKKFAESKQCDFDEMSTLYGLQSLSMRTIAMKGEVFIFRRRDASKFIPFQLQVLSPNMIDHNKTSFIVTERSGNYIVQGIEFSATGKKVGVWVFDHNPNNQYMVKLAPKFVSIEDVTHVFYKEFPEQVRGVPFGTASMLGMADLDDYKDAQLMLQKISACHVAFTTKQIDAGQIDTDANGNQVDRMEPGMIEKLSPGEEVTFNNPPTANGYAEYVSKNQQSSAAGFGITYEQLTGDLKNVNFSSGRMGWMEAQRQIEDWQYNMFIPQWCEKIYGWFIEGLKMRGVISKDVKAEWTPQGREMIDPVKEMNGLILELKSGLISWDEACKRRGYNPDTLFSQILSDKKKFKSAGIEVEWILAPAEQAAEGSGEAGSVITPENLKRILDAYGVGVRAGTITPTESDEEYFRSLAKFPEMGEAVISAWKADGGFRRPITLAVPIDSPDFEA